MHTLSSPLRWLPTALLLVACAGCAALTKKESAWDSTSGLDATSQRDYAARQASFESADEQAQPGYQIKDFAPQNITKTVRRMAGQDKRDEALARELFQRAESKYQEASQLDGDPRQAAFREAAELFESAAKLFPDSGIEHDALYMMGASHFFADNYSAANDAYERLLKKYPNSKMLDAAESHRFAIAQYWLELQQEKPKSFWSLNLTDKTRPLHDTRGHAMRVFDRIRIDDPTGKLADDATMALANSYFRAANYVMADVTYTDLIKSFPESEHQFDAHLLGVKSKLLSYQGAKYTGAGLDEAEKLIKQARAQFPQRAAQERSYLDRAHAEVRFRKAEREWATAQFYDRRKEHRAARQYYEIITRDYSDTPFDEKARQRLAQLVGLPDIPPQRLSWLVDLFPKQETVQPLMATKPSADPTR